MKKNYLALGGLFASLHVLFLLLSKFIVGSELLLVLFLPLLSTIYTLKCDNKSIVMFAISTILVCSIFDIVGTFIYVIPSFVCGIVYGGLRKKKIKELELLCVSSVAHCISILLSFFVIAFLFKEIDFLGIFLKIFELEGDKLFVFSLCFLLVLGCCEAFLVHIVSENELKKFNYKTEKNDSVPPFFKVGAVISFISFVVLYFINNLYSVLMVFILFIFIIPYIVCGINNFKYRILTIILVIICSLISIFFIKYLEPLNYFIIPIFIASPFMINNFKDINEKDF